MRWGHYALCVVEFRRGPPRIDRGPNLAASYFEWPFAERRPDLLGGGSHFPLVERGLLRFVPPRDFSACTGVTPGAARGDSISDPGEIIAEYHVNWGHVSTSQLKRLLVDSEGGNSYLANFVDDVAEHCDVCKALEKAPRVPIPGATTVSMFNDKV